MTRLQAAVWLVLGAGALFLGLPRRCKAQQFERDVRMTDEVRAYLNAQWDTVHAGQVERAYCLAVTRALATEREGADTVSVVIGAYRAVAVRASETMTYFDCGRRMARLHIHTPTTCAKDGPCEMGGPGAHLCLPSPQDVYNLRGLGHLWGMIQCDRNAFVVFYSEAGAGGLYADPLGERPGGVP